MNTFVKFMQVAVCTVGVVILTGILLYMVNQLGDELAKATANNRAEYDRVMRLCIIKEHETKQPWEMIGNKCVLNSNL